MDKFLAAYTAAGRLDDRTSEHTKDVAYRYLAWINAQSSETAAIQALLEASLASTREAKVLVKAAALILSNVPTATAISPATGTTAGGTAVTITGTNLLGVTAVTFGGTTATAILGTSDTTVTCVTPAKTAGAVTVVITTTTGSVTKTTFYTYA